MIYELITNRASDLQKRKAKIVEREQTKKIILNYLVKNGPVKGNCVKIAWDLYDTLSMTVGAVCFFMRNLLNRGELTYSNGTYIIAKKKVNRNDEG